MPRRSLPRSVPRSVPLPIAIEDAYWLELRGITREVEREVRRELFPLVLRWRAPGEVSDALEDEHARVIEGVRVRIGRAWPVARIREVARRAGQLVFDFAKRTQVKILRGLGVNVFAGDEELRAVRDAFVAENVNLIQTIAPQALDRVEQRVVQAIAEGTRHERLAKDIKEEFGIADRRARVIARDQVSKHNGDLARERQTRSGVEWYEWRTARDERVRPTHAQNEGGVFAWASPPPITGHPGNDIQCRCVAIPLLGDFLERARSEGRVRS